MNSNRAAAAEAFNEHLILDTIPHFVWVARPDGSSEYLNRRCREYLGLAPEGVPAWDWRATVHPDDLGRSLAAWEAAQRTGAAYEFEYRLRGRDGAYRWFLGRAEPQLDAAGRPARWFGTSTDVDGQKRAEAALRASEARFRAIVERSHDGFVLLDPGRVVQFISPTVRRILGFPAEEFIGQDAFGWAHPDDRPGLGAWLAHLIDKPGGTVEVWYRFRHRDGSYRRLEVAATNLLDEPDVQAIVATFRDITSRK